MSGTGPTGPTPAEAHLGDRLAALVDGELKHDARERVLAHLATCARCKAEADAQRRLKSAFAMSAAPSPSEGFLARLQGLPGGPGGDGTGSDAPFGGRGPFADEFFPALRPPGGTTRADAAPSPLSGFGYVPAAHGSTAVLPGGPLPGRSSAYTRRPATRTARPGAGGASRSPRPAPSPSRPSRWAAACRSTPVRSPPCAPRAPGTTFLRSTRRPVRRTAPRRSAAGAAVRSPRPAVTPSRRGGPPARRRPA